MTGDDDAAQRYARDADRGLLAGVGELVQGLVRLPGRLQRALAALGG